MEAEEKSYFSYYIVGFILSLILTLATYFIVTLHLLALKDITLTISSLAVAQATVQLFLFLRIGQEKKPHWKMTVFLFMMLVLVIIVIGSLWIMYSLNYNVMPGEMDVR